jgi:hypothetical protein
MKSFIQITRHLDGEPHYMNLVIIACNGKAMGSQEIYLNTKSVKDMGENLVDFPNFERSNYLFERGSERSEDNFAWYFRFRAFAKGSLKKCAIQIRLNNNEKHNKHRRPNEAASPYEPQLTDFCITLDAEHVRRLGELLIDFSKMNHDRLYWNDEAGYLDNIVGQPPDNLGDIEREAFAVLPQ